MHPSLARTLAAPMAVQNAVGAGFIRDPVTRVPGGDLSDELPVHALIVWEDGQVEQVWGFATAWNREHVRVIFWRRGQWMIWLRAQHVCRCTCQDW